jgi:hypothetical protein
MYECESADLLFCITNVVLLKDKVLKYVANDLKYALIEIGF